MSGDLSGELSGELDSLILRLVEVVSIKMKKQTNLLEDNPVVNMSVRGVSNLWLFIAGENNLGLDLLVVGEIKSIMCL